MASIITPDDFDVSKITYGTPRDLGTTGGRMIYINYNKGPILLQTPEMSSPYGMKDFEGNKNYTIDLSFKGKESREKLNTFFEKLNELDEKLVNDGMDNSLTWLRKKINSKVVAETIYTKMVKYSKDKNTGEISDKWPPTMKVKIPFKDGKFDCEVYNANKELVDLSTIETKGARVTAIIQCLGIWVAGGKYGISWKAISLKVLPPPTIKGYMFKDDPEDKVKEDDIDEVDEELAGEVAGKLNTKEDEIIASSDEEDDLDNKPKKK